MRPDPSIRFPLPSAIWSTNDERKLHHYDRAERIKEWKTAVRYHYQRIYGRSPQPPSVIQITIREYVAFRNTPAEDMPPPGVPAPETGAGPATTG